jgi:hypothetical protein
VPPCRTPAPYAPRAGGFVAASSSPSGPSTPIPHAHASRSVPTARANAKALAHRVEGLAGIVPSKIQLTYLEALRGDSHPRPISRAGRGSMPDWLGERSELPGLRMDTPWMDTPWMDTPWMDTPWMDTPWMDTPWGRPPGGRDARQLDALAGFARAELDSGPTVTRRNAASEQIAAWRLRSPSR